MIKPIVSRYTNKLKSSSGSKNNHSGNSNNGNKSVGSDSSRSVEMGSRNQNHSQANSERHSTDDEDSESMKHIVGKCDGLEICTNKTYEVTYENSASHEEVVKERVHSLSMGYGAKSHIAGGNTNNV